MNILNIVVPIALGLSLAALLIMVIKLEVRSQTRKLRIDSINNNLIQIDILKDIVKNMDRVIDMVELNETESLDRDIKTSQMCLDNQTALLHTRDSLVRRMEAKAPKKSKKTK